MLVTRTSRMTGVEHTLEIDVTQEALDRYAAGRELIQNVFPTLTAAEREFILSGTTDEEWKAALGTPEDES